MAKRSPLASFVFVLAGLIPAGCSSTSSSGSTSGSGASPSPSIGSVTTYHNDLARTGQYLSETQLTPTTVGPGKFAQLFSHAVDGNVYAQPLYLPNVTITGAAAGVHNVVFVATEHDSVYAFDADSNTGQNAGPLWQTSFLLPGSYPVPSTDTYDFYPDRRDFGNGRAYCTDIVPEIGITSTPVIDPAAGILYVVARTKEGDGYVQRLHALSVQSGADVHSPQVIQASVPGTGDGGTTITFDPLFQNQRAGLVLSDGVVYAAWASHCDASPNTAYGTPVWFHGWVMGFDASSLALVSAFVTTPDADPANTLPAYGPGGAQQGGEGGIWASGGAPAVDASGSLYLITANGIFDANSGSAPNTNYGDSLLKLTTGAAGGSAPVLSVADYFTPGDEATLETFDIDFGSSSPLLLPDQTTGPATHLLVACGKEGTIFLVNRDNLGKFNPTQDQVVERLFQVIPGGAFSVPAYWNGHVYFVAAGDSLKDFPLVGGLLSPNPVASAEVYEWPGATPSISANGTANAIAWVLDTSAFSSKGTPGPAVLRAYNAANVAQPYLWSSADIASDQGPPAVKFSVPTIANGKVYVAGAGGLSIYGLTSGAASNPPQ